MKTLITPIKFSRRVLPLIATLLCMMLFPLISAADTASDIKALIIDTANETKANMKDTDGGIAASGALMFWSSGGLMQNVAAGGEPSEYEVFSLTPKHIEVVTLVEGQAAVAMYYSEGSMHEKGGKPVDHYMTRITEVYVNEDGNWNMTAAHYSPIAAGSGTKATAVQ